MSKELSIVHFAPIEKYPPVLNMIGFLKSQGFVLFIHTQAPPSNKKTFSSEDSDKIYRLGHVQTRGKIFRIFSYISFTFNTFFRLLRTRPESILYYESLSAMPVILYAKMRPNTKILVHYHEYTSPSDYSKGMIFNRISFFFERRNYDRFKWISHTNAQRIQLFKENFQIPESIIIHELPNYPPSSWKLEHSDSQNESSIIKLVYLGSVGFDTMYTQEICSWVKSRINQVELHFYSDQMDKKSKEFISELNAPNIFFHGAVEYNEVPEILREYKVGLILYKGTIDNYKYVVPNKYFEYLCCGLDVWYPDKIKSMEGFESVDYIPKVLSLDFEKLETYNLPELLSKKGLPQRNIEFFAESVYKDLLPYLVVDSLDEN